jgi:hypothetical protein
MAANIYDLSTTAGSNTTIDGVDVSGATGKVKDGDNVMRSLAAFNAQWIDDQGGVATTAGTANAQTVTLASGFTAYAAGQIFRVKIGSGLTNASSTVTINVNSIGTKTVKVNYGGVLADPIPGDIQAGAYATFLYDGTYLVLLDPQQRAPYPSGHLYGLTLSNDAGDLTNDIGIAVGTCRDSTDAANIDLASALIKKLDAAWAVGTNQGMLDGTESVAGTPDTSTWYHIYAIKRPDTGVVDVLASESATAPTMPTNYTLKRRLGAVYNDSSGNIKAFRQVGDIFRWVSSVTDRSSTSAVAAANLALTVPTGISVRPLIAGQITSLGAIDALVSVGDGAASSTEFTAAYIYTSGATGAAAVYSVDTLLTNTSAQIKFAVTINSGSLGGINALSTVGWIDTRGRG